MTTPQTKQIDDSENMSLTSQTSNRPHLN